MYIYIYSHLKGEIRNVEENLENWEHIAKWQGNTQKAMNAHEPFHPSLPKKLKNIHNKIHFLVRPKMAHPGYCKSIIVHRRHLPFTYLQYIFMYIYIYIFNWLSFGFRKKPLLLEEHVNFDSNSLIGLKPPSSWCFFLADSINILHHEVKHHSYQVIKFSWEICKCVGVLSLRFGPSNWSPPMARRWEDLLAFCLWRRWGWGVAAGNSWGWKFSHFDVYPPGN